MNRSSVDPTPLVTSSEEDDVDHSDSEGSLFDGFDAQHVSTFSVGGGEWLRPA